MMRIVADENIPLLREFFGELGEIEAVAGRTMTAEQVRHADVLLVRSVTTVDEKLLAGSRVRFVGTATIGCDHVDLSYLRANAIGFASAPGCNATSVVEYVIASLTVLAERNGFDWLSERVGIVGLGNVGSRLKATLEELGVNVLANDPPLAAQGRTDLVSLDEVLTCDVISLHTPLTKTGAYPTHHLLAADQLAKIGPRQILLNTGRGPVVHEQALLQKLEQTPHWPVVLDVWETEPRINLELLKRVQIGSPHIAGYSLDGKMRGTEMIYKALCDHLNIAPVTSLAKLLPPAPLGALEFSAQAAPVDVLTTAIRACYDPRTDDAQLRCALKNAGEDGGAAAFDLLRKNYRTRREFARVTLKLPDVKSPAALLAGAAGFRIAGFSQVAGCQER